jgi:hypothetical protein
MVVISGQGYHATRPRYPRKLAMEILHAACLPRSMPNSPGGRAWRFEMHPLVSEEIREFDLLRALNHGLAPAHFNK